ncbi:MAG: DMT family transporter, partial [Pseudomonadota bacterium]
VEGVGRGELLALGAPICFAAYVILTRRAGGQANQIGQLLWVSIGALMLLSVMAWFYWLPIDQEAFGLLLISSVVFLGIYLLQIAAFSSGETSVIAPFSYLHIGTAAGAGYLFFGTIPDLVAWIGMGMIVISGVIVALRS